MLRSLDIVPGGQPQLRASELYSLDLRNANGSGSGSIINGDVKLNVPDHIDYVAGIRFFSNLTARFALPAQTIPLLEASLITVTLKEPDSEIIVNQIPIIRFMPGTGQVGHLRTQSWTELWFAPGIMIDPRQSFLTTWAKGITRSVPYQFLYW